MGLNSYGCFQNNNESWFLSMDISLRSEYRSGTKATVGESSTRDTNLMYAILLVVLSTTSREWLDRQPSFYSTCRYDKVRVLIYSRGKCERIRFCNLFNGALKTLFGVILLYIILLNLHAGLQNNLVD